MQAKSRLLIITALTLLVVGCQHDPITRPPVDSMTADLAPAGFDARLAAAEIVAASGWEVDPAAEFPKQSTESGDKCLGFILDWSREMLLGDIAHYSYLVQVGAGPYDRIMVHRVIKERRPLQPLKTRHAIMLQHGDCVGFGKFLYGKLAPSAPDDHAAAIYLAQNDVDVWGIDQNWVLVPEATTDFGFMQNWGMDNQIANLNAALATARYTRLFTGNGFRKMHLLGYSSGGATGYAYINAEAVIPYGHRHVKGFVCADMLYKYAPEVDRQFVCQDVALMAQLLADGTFEWAYGFEPMGRLAAEDPDGESPLFPGYTNLQVVLITGGATFMLWPFNEWWHYWGATFDPEEGMPVSFNFLSLDNVTDFMRLGCPWEALRFIYDYERIICDEEDVPWDDNLALVDMPILYLEPAGGIGSTGRYTLGLLGSNDVQIVTVSLRPPDQITEDFGHIDIWTAPQAVSLVWQPLLEWIVSHPGRGADDEVYLTAETMR